MKTNTLKNTSLSLVSKKKLSEAFFLCCQICALDAKKKRTKLREYNMPHAVVCPICHVSHGTNLYRINRVVIKRALKRVMLGWVSDDKITILSVFVPVSICATT
ncbi:hypothetical protein ACJX0J_032851, partial [Zea mays]